jgi:hypothetical protein
MLRFRAGITQATLTPAHATYFQTYANFKPFAAPSGDLGALVRPKLQPITVPLNAANPQLAKHINPPVPNPAVLAPLVNALPGWETNTLGGVDQQVLVAAAAYYRSVLAVIAEPVPGGGGAWRFQTGLTLPQLAAQDRYFTPTGTIKAFDPGPTASAAAIQFRLNGLFPYRTAPNLYTMPIARGRMGVAAPQIAFALTFLVHKSVRQKLLLRAAAGKFAALSDGAIIIDNMSHPPITLTGGTVWNPFGLSMGSTLGVFFLSHRTPMRLYALTAHEWAHLFIIKHWFTAPGATKTEHDQSDMNCMMGYPYLVGQGTVLPAAPPPMTPARQELEDFVNDYGDATKYRMFLNGDAGGSFGVLKQRMLPENLTQHFCGKCVLQLRGWNIYAGAANPVLPRSSTGPHNQDVFPDVANYNALTFDQANL